MNFTIWYLALRDQGCICFLAAFLRVTSISSGEGDGTPLQYSCLENPMDGGAW